MKLTIDDDYDFEANKVIPKPDPNHPTRGSTSLLAFGEPTWEPRARLYLEKGILKMKEKDWKNIMKVVAETTTILKKKGHHGGACLTEEDAELSWESESD